MSTKARWLANLRTSPRATSSFEHLIPPEIIRQVAEYAASIDIKSALALSLVCHQVHHWVQPFLFGNICLSNETALQAFRASLSANTTLGPLVNSLWVGSISSESTPPSKRWPQLSFQQAFIDILKACRRLKKLALIHVPSYSTAAWEIVEETLPETLSCFLAGPDHAVILNPQRYPNLLRFISVETLLEMQELTTLRSMPRLRQFDWCFLRLRLDRHAILGIRELLRSPNLVTMGIAFFGLEGDEFDDGAEAELLEIEEDRRVKKIHVFHVLDWCSALYRHWTMDWT